MRHLLVLVLAISPLACLRSTQFTCASTAECGTDGVCEANSFCSFTDATCPMGRRYGELSGPFAGKCVGEEPGIDGGIDGTDAERRRGAHEVRPARGREQRLGRHAAVVQAVAAHLVLLDQRHGDAELGGGRRHREASGPGADHAQVDARLEAGQAVRAGGAAGLGRVGPLGRLAQPPPPDRPVTWQVAWQVTWLRHASSSVSSIS